MPEIRCSPPTCNIRNLILYGPIHGCWPLPSQLGRVSPGKSNRKWWNHWRWMPTFVTTNAEPVLQHITTAIQSFGFKKAGNQTRRNIENLWNVTVCVFGGFVDFVAHKRLTDRFRHGLQSWALSGCLESPFIDFCKGARTARTQSMTF